MRYHVGFYYQGNNTPIGVMQDTSPFPSFAVGQHYLLGQNDRHEIVDVTYAVTSASEGWDSWTVVTLSAAQAPVMTHPVRWT